MKNDITLIAKNIRSNYIESEPTALDELRALDKAVKLPPRAFAYILGSIAAIIMGFGMSLIMTDFGAAFFGDISFALGILFGALGLMLAALTYPIHNAILRRRKARYSVRILALTEKIISE